MKRGTRWTRFAHRAIGVSVVIAVVVAAIPLVHHREDRTTLRLAAADLRSEAAEGALVARTWDARRTTGAFTRAQAAQLAHRIAGTRSEVRDAPVELAPTASAVVAMADTLLLAMGDLQALPAPDDASPRAHRLASLVDDLRAIERALAPVE